MQGIYIFWGQILVNLQDMVNFQQICQNTRWQGSKYSKPGSQKFQFDGGVFPKTG